MMAISGGRRWWLARHESKDELLKRDGSIQEVPLENVVGREFESMSR
jgi:hypothetical protein